MGHVVTASAVEVKPPRPRLHLVRDGQDVPPGPPAADSETWDAAVERYATWLLAGGRSAGTIRLHRHYLGLLARVVTGPWSATDEDLLQVLASTTWRAETRKSCRSVFATFYGWALVAGRITRNPADGLPKITVPARTARPAPLEALRVGLENADAWQRRARRGQRLNVRLMLLLAAYAGLRCVEVAAVHHDDYSDGLLYVTGKGGKRRVVPIEHPELVTALSTFEGYLFPWREGHVTPGHVTRLMSAMLPDHWTGHTLRHRFATEAYAGTRDLLAVGQLLGHSRPETTQRYVRLPSDALLAGVRAAASEAGSVPPASTDPS